MTGSSYAPPPITEEEIKGVIDQGLEEKAIEKDEMELVHGALKFDDTVIRSVFLSDADIGTMIESTTIGKIIQGVRGEKPVDVDKVKSVIKSVAQMMIDNEYIIECDLNPLLIGEDNQIYAVDTRIKC